MQTAGKPTGPDVISAGPSNARLLNLLLPSILALIVVRLWLMPLPSSFWIDEMATVFVVHNGPKDASLQVAPQVALSIYYVLPGMLARFFGNSEVAYRVPSVLAMAAALFFVFRLAVRFIHPEAGWLAVFARLSLRGINYQAADARPYALGTCIAAGSLLLGFAGWIPGISGMGCCLLPWLHCCGAFIWSTGPSMAFMSHIRSLGWYGRRPRFGSATPR